LRRELPDDAFPEDLPPLFLPSTDRFNAPTSSRAVATQKLSPRGLTPGSIAVSKR
jgi:hypothetical protein